jgi:hypothetical protein
MQLTQQEVKDVLRYNPDTGDFTWRVSRRGTARAGSVAGSINDRGYWRVMYCGKSHYAHRLAWLYMHGEFPPGEIDHINHIKDDNRLSNLRLATSKDNNRNRGLSSSNTSGFTGVVWHKRNCKWRAQMKRNCKSITLGEFDNIEDAVAARRAANIKYKFHKNHGIQQPQDNNNATL